MNLLSANTFKMFFLLFLVSFQSNALEISRNESNQVMINAANCEAARAEVRALSLWKSNLGEGLSCDPDGLKYELSDKSCSVEVTSCLPMQAAKFHNIKPKVSGPNCWNLALVSQKLLPALRQVKAEEFSAILSSPMCRQLPESEDPIAGDIGAIRAYDDQGGEEEHGFIYISKNLSYSKFDTTTSSAFQIHAIEIDLDGYNVGPHKNCSKNNVAQLNGSCPKTVKYFRCTTLAKWYGQNFTSDSQLGRVLDQLNLVERDLERHLLADVQLQPNSSSLVESFRMTLDNYLSILKNRKTNELSVPEVQLLRLLRYRLLGIHEQVITLGTLQITENLVRESFQRLRDDAERVLYAIP